MLDTVGIQCGARLRDASLFRHGTRMIPFGKRWKGRIRDGLLVRVEGSLAHYNAGRLPRTGVELSTALANVFADIAAFAEMENWWFDRLDLAVDVAEPTAPLGALADNSASPAFVRPQRSRMTIQASAGETAALSFRCIFTMLQRDTGHQARRVALKSDCAGRKSSGGSYSRKRHGPDLQKSSPALPHACLTQLPDFRRGGLGLGR